MGDQIRAILKHYQQDDPVGLPGAPIPDPMPVPDMKHSFSVYTMTFKEMQVYGLSKFRIEHMTSELALMQVKYQKIDEVTFYECSVNLLFMYVYFLRMYISIHIILV